MSEPGNGHPVSRDLWREAHQNLVARVEDIETWQHDHDVAERARLAAWEAEARARRWQLILGVFMATLPLIFAALVTYVQSGARP